MESAEHDTRLSGTEVGKTLVVARAAEHPVERAVEMQVLTGQGDLVVYRKQGRQVGVDQ